MLRRARAPRLCMVVHGPYPVGEPRVARETAAALAAGWDVDVVAMRRDGEPARELVEGATVYRLPLTHQRGGGVRQILAEYVGFATLAALRVAALASRRRYDVVHVHNPPDFLVLAALYPRLLGAKVVFDVHDLSPDMFEMRFEGRSFAPLADRVLRGLERAAIRAADLVVTVHEPYRRELLARGAAPESTVVVMNSQDESLLPAATDQAAAAEFRVVYHGTVTRSYGLDLLVEAAALARRRIPALRVEIYGGGDAVEELRSQSADLGVADIVHVDGEYRPHREILAAVAGASAGVIPNRPSRLNRFALSSKLFEYVALGVPVVSANLPTLAEHFTSDAVAFFEAGSAEALAEALVEVASDPGAAASRVAAARREYEPYRWPRQAEMYVAALRELAGGATSRAGGEPATRPRWRRAQRPV
ncbi:MAG: hypothetical protein QOE36_1611 [Gaiellaceae bacterium]|nr:hypothetical protein [Gaiellaceae bacterium]